MNEQLKSILIWTIVILVIIGLGLLARYVVVIFPPPHIVNVTPPTRLEFL
jgi:4-amino-4-deoxy-L-arabinose transferase-like glycosyltransferase